MFYQQLFGKGPRSEVSGGHNPAGVQAKQAAAEVTAQEATQGFQAKGKEDRRKWMKASEDMGQLAAPNPLEIW